MRDTSGGDPQAYLDYLQRMPSPTELLPDDLAAQLPPLRGQEHLGWDGIVHVKYFSPYTNWTWYATEYDGVDEFYGFVIGFEPEAGYFTLSELQSMGALIERDLYFTPAPLRDVVRTHGVEPYNN